MKAKKNPVIFRTFKDTKEVIALFPLEPFSRTDQGWAVVSYMHTGQHSAASPELMREGTRPATPKQIKPLLSELRRIYKRGSLKVAKRFPRNAYAVRKAKLSN